MSASRASVPRPSSSRLVSSQTAGWERISIRVSCPGTMAGALIRPIKRGWDGGFIEAHLFRAAACSFFESGPRIPGAGREVTAGTVLSPSGIFGSSVFKRFNTDTLLEIATPRKTNFVAVCAATRPPGGCGSRRIPIPSERRGYRLEYAEMTRLRWFEHCMLS
jgi:hypothetical protein